MEIPGHGEVKIKNTDSKYWSATSLPWMSIGYEVSVPPIYTLMLYNAIANNGTMVKPLFTEGIMKDGQYISVTPVEVVKEKIASDRALNQMRGILEGVVAKGTAKNMQSPLFTSAGKTGTSQVQEGGSKKDKEGKTRHQITFCGYFPAENPMYTCIVYVRDHKKGGTSSVCGEVYKKVAEKAYILHTQRKDTTVQANWDLANIDKQEITAQQLKNQLTGEVPNVTGLSMDQAVYLLENQQINTEIKGYGRVKEQSIMPGTPVDKVKKITLIGENK
jgi:cell division protein FtsI (penicillin-binding protein 3)